MNKIEIMSLVQELNATIADKSYNYNQIYSKLVDGLNADIMAEENKKSGKTNLAKSMNEIIKNAKKHGIRAFMGSFVCDDGYTYVCDGFRAIGTNQPIELEKIPEDCIPFHCDTMFKNIPSVEVAIDFDIAKISADIKLNKKNKKKTALVISDNVAVDASFFLDAYNSSNFDKVLCKDKRTPVYMINDTTKTIIMPINMHTNSYSKGDTIAI